MPATLAITGGGLPPRTVELTPGTTTLGRADSSGIMLNHANVSRSHLEIRIDATGTQIADLNSVNGTRVNDLKLDPHAWQRLSHGDIIEIGPFHATYEEAVEDSGATVVMSRTVIMPRTPALAPPPPPPPPPEPVAPPTYVPPPEPIAAPTYVPPRQPVVPPPPPRAPEPVVAWSPPLTPETQVVQRPEPEQAPTPAIPWQQAVPAAASAPPVYSQPYVARPHPAARGSRDSLALLLLVVATILTLPASFAVWNQRVLGNEDQFVALGNKVLSEPAVQRELARQLAADVDNTTEDVLRTLVPKEIEQAGRQILNSILGTQPATTQGTGTNNQVGFTEQIMLDVVRTMPNTPVATAALRATHQAFQTALRDESIQANNGAIVLDISGGTSDLFRIAGMPAITGAQLKNDWGRIEITRNADAVRALQLMRFMDGKAIIFVVLVAAAFVAGLYFADDRARYAKLIGIAVAGSAALWIVMAKGPLKPYLLQGGGETASEKAAVEAIYGVGVNTFMNQEFIVIGVGIVIFAIGLFMSQRAAQTASPPPVTQ